MLGPSHSRGLLIWFSEDPEVYYFAYILLDHMSSELLRSEPGKDVPKTGGR